MKKEIRDTTYRLLGDVAPVSFLLKTGRAGDLVHFDKKTRVPKAIRHCPNDSSIFISDQTEFALVETIDFEKGFLVVRADQTSTKKFLDNHPDNGRIFQEIDHGKEASEEIELEELILDLKQAVKEKAKEEDGVYELQALASALLGSVSRTADMSKSELKREIYIHIDRNPQRFLDDKGNVDLFDANIKRVHIALLALQEDHIRIASNRRSILWGGTGAIITNVPSGYKPLDHFAAFLETEDGILVLNEIRNLVAGKPASSVTTTKSKKKAA